jgi:lipid-binding SYLF domain-containing protein
LLESSNQSEQVDVPNFLFTSLAIIACLAAIVSYIFGTMKSSILNKLLSSSLLLVCSILLSQCASGPITKMNASSVDSRELASDSRKALNKLYQSNPTARKLGSSAKGILVFPEVTKAGLMIGGMAGNGALIRNDGTIRDFYQTAGASYGLQAGAQQYGYALFLMDSQAFANINKSSGWEVGASPSLVIVDEGKAASLSTTTVDAGTYAFFFNQRGLMGGLGLQGSKITRIRPSR